MSAPQFTVDVGDMVHALDQTQRAWAPLGYAVADGCEPFLDGDLTIAVEDGEVYHDGTAVTVENASETIPSGQSDPRKDTLFIDGNGDLQSKQGEPAEAEPLGLQRERTFLPAPPIPDDRHVVVAEVWVAADATALGTGDIRDRRDTSLTSSHTGEFDRLDVTPLASGTFTLTGGSTPAAEFSAPGVTTDETQAVELLLAANEPPAFAGDYAYNYKYSRAWDDANGELDVDMQVTWDNDPGDGNDVTVAYQILPRY